MTRDALSQHEQSHALSSPGHTEPPTGQLRVENFGNVSMREISDLLASKNPTEIGLIAHDLERLPAGSKTQAAITQFFKAWAQLDPDAALRAAISFSDRSNKETALRAIFDSATPEAAGRLTAALKGAGPDAIAPIMRSELLTAGIAKWSQVDPAAAAAFLEQNPDATTAERMNTPGGASMLAGRLAGNWARIDPVAAMAWAERQADARGARQGAIAGWWEKDPAGAEEYALSHLGNFEDGKLAGIVANRMAAHDPKRAAEWIAKLPEETRGLAIIDVAMPWGYRAPRDASEWAMGLPASERGTALGAIASQWARNDPAAAGQWLGSLTGPGRDEAIATYTNTIARIDPTTALSWTATMSDDAMRDRATQQVIALWMARDRQAARDWVQRSGFGDEQKTRLLNLPPSG